MKQKRIDNPDVIPYALYELGGAGEFIDVEDVFVRCHEIAPERFRWRKHNLPNYKTLAKALRDFENHHPVLLIKTPDGLSRQLSAEGIEWIRERIVLLTETFSVPGMNPPTRRREHRILNELASHKVVREFLGGAEPNFLKHEIADLLLCAPDSPPSVWRERLETYRSAAADSGRPDLLRFLKVLYDQRGEWFGGR